MIWIERHSWQSACSGPSTTAISSSGHGVPIAGGGEEMLRARRRCERTVKDTKVRAGRAGGGHAAFGKLRSTCPLLTATTLSPL